MNLQRYLSDFPEPEDAGVSEEVFEELEGNVFGGWDGQSAEWMDWIIGYLEAEIADLENLQEDEYDSERFFEIEGLEMDLHDWRVALVKLENLAE